MPIERANRRVAASRLAASARDLLDASTLCAIATVSPSGGAHINTAYFAWNVEFEVVWLSHPESAHSRNLHSNESAAVAVYRSTQAWGKSDRGIQLFGSAWEAQGEHLKGTRTVYADRFLDFRDSDAGQYRFYRFQPERLKLFDEQAFGAGTFITARLDERRRLTWEGTDILRPG